MASILHCRLSLTSGAEVFPCPLRCDARRLTDNLQLYDMYDNSRDWGPSFLVGLPAHHLGDQSRVDDTRLVPRVDSQDGSGAADPSSPPQSQASPTVLTAKPLPAVP
jgi:hypothetical protein